MHTPIGSKLGWKYNMACAPSAGGAMDYPVRVGLGEAGQTPGTVRSVQPMSCKTIILLI
jgi:hypothetical protein